mgnify:CR=1 FL=1
MKKHLFVLLALSIVFYSCQNDDGSSNTETDPISQPTDTPPILDSDPQAEPEQETTTVNVSTIKTPEWSFSDDFEGSRNPEFWLGEGISLDYGYEDPTDPANKVMAMRYLPNSEGGGDSWSEYDFRLGIDAMQVEMGWKMYIPTDYEHIENNHKVFALWSGTYGKVNANISLSSEAWGKDGGATPSVYVGEDGNNYGHAMRSDTPLIWNDGLGKWIDIHIIISLAESEGEFGKMELFLNGQLLTGTHHPNLTKPYGTAPESNEIIKFSSRGNFIDQGTVLGWANGEIGFGTETVFLIDEFYVNANATFSDINWRD